MAKQTNVNIVKQYLNTFLSHDPEETLATLTDDIRWEVQGAPNVPTGPVWFVPRVHACPEHARVYFGHQAVVVRPRAGYRKGGSDKLGGIPMDLLIIASNDSL